MLILLIMISLPASVFADNDAVGKADFIELRNAIKSDNLIAVKALYQDADLLNSEDAYGVTPLHLAIENDSLAMVQLLVEQGAKINPVVKTVTRNRGRKGTPLSLAVQTGPWTGIAAYLIEQGADLDAHGADGMTPLVQATLRNVESIQLLLDSGALVNGPDSAGFTALDYTLGMGLDNVDASNIAILLLNHGAKMGRKTMRGGAGRKKNPLLVAVINSDIEKIEEIGALSSQRVKTPIFLLQALKIAMHRRDYAVIDALKSSGLWPQYSYSAAREAVRFNDARTLQEILKETPELLSTEFLPLTDQLKPRWDNDYNGHRYKKNFTFNNSQLGWLSNNSDEGYSDELITVLKELGVTDNVLVTYSVGSQMRARGMQTALLPYRRMLFAYDKLNTPKVGTTEIAYEYLIDRADKRVVLKKVLHDKLRERLGCTVPHYNLCHAIDQDGN